MLKNLFFKIRKLLFKGVVLFALAIRKFLNFALREEAKSIPLERQRRALGTTVEYVEKYMRHVDSVGTRKELLTRAFRLADVNGDRLICEFGVFLGASINHLAQMTGKTVFGFDSFEGLPERWSDGCAKGMFAMPSLPKVRKNVTLVQGWFDQSLPEFLEKHTGQIGFLHVDSDLYSSAKIIFDLLESRLKSGAVVVFDEYFNYPGWEEGEYKAFMEYLIRSGLSFEFIGYHRNEEQVAVILRQKAC
jgi:predicted O-methyltransferase YrrM